MHQHIIKPFIPNVQYQAISEAGKNVLYNELKRLGNCIKQMPFVYETQHQPLADKIVYLHYFAGDFDWYILEKDISPEQYQAFGLVRFQNEVELGYISIEEMKSITLVNIDLHWQPKPVRQIQCAKHLLDMNEEE